MRANDVPEIYEASLDTLAIFPLLYRDAVLFVLPPRDSEKDYGGRSSLEVQAEVVPKVAAALERMRLPFPSIAIRCTNGGPSGFITDQTTIFEVIDETLIFQAMLLIGDVSRMMRYVADFEIRDGIIMRVRPNRALASVDERMAGSMAITGLTDLLTLFEVLTSTAYSAVETIVSRQQSRSSGNPRRSYTISVRPAREADVPTAKAIFASIVRVAHAVRGHLRTDHRTGEKTIRVRPHLRGRGDAVQIKDYVISPAAKQRHDA